MSSKIKWGITEDAVEEAIRGVLDRAYAHDETIADEKYLPRTGGTMTGNLTLDPVSTTQPVLSLVNPEASDGSGPSRVTLRKNAGDTADYGTILTDFTWGNGSTTQKQAQLRLWAKGSEAQRLLLIYRDGDGAETIDTIFGSHNPPRVADVSGLQDALNEKADTNHTHSYLPLSGGTLTGNEVIQNNAISPSLTLSSPEKILVGRGRTVLYKNASNTTDYGTLLADYTYGEDTKHIAVQLQSAAGSLADRIMFVNYSTDGSYIRYHLYGEHNKPGITDVSGLQDALDAISTTGGYDGVLPISNGGTGATNAIDAITALGGLSTATRGISIPSGANIDEYTTPGTYYAVDGDVAASLQGTPPWTTAGFKLYVTRGYQNVIFQFAQAAAAALYVRVRQNLTADWGEWTSYAYANHTHGNIRSDGTITPEDTVVDTSDRLLITDMSDGGKIKRARIVFDGATRDKALTPNGTWEKFMTLSGGTFTGSITLDPTGTAMPLFTLVSAEKADLGAGRTMLYKNASTENDNGTQLVDYTWGNGISTENKNTRLVISAGATQLAKSLMLTKNEGDGTAPTTYQIYGEHNRPWIESQPRINPGDDLNTFTTVGWYRCPINATAQQIKHTPGYDTTTLLNSSMHIFNLTVGEIGPVSNPYIYQELLVYNTGKRWYRYTLDPTTQNVVWTEWVET